MKKLKTWIRIRIGEAGLPSQGRDKNREESNGMDIGLIIEDDMHNASDGCYFAFHSMPDYKSSSD